MREEALVEVIRGGQIESRHHVSFTIVDSAGQLRASWGDAGLVTFLRSSAKPFQAIPFVESGAADHFHFNSKDLALVCASHSGTDMHFELACRLLERTGITEEALLCGIHAPNDEETYRNLLSSGGELKPIRNNCSGKHVGMLAMAKFLDNDLETYLDQEHPVQNRILDVLAEMVGVPADSILIGVDGCSAPTFAIPLHAAAYGYARLVDAKDCGAKRAEACSKIFNAMTTHPEFVAGPARFDTVFMQAVKGRMVSKSGAEGFQSIGIPADGLEGGSPALGIAIKVHDGDHKDHHAAALIAIELVDRLGGFKPGERATLADFDARKLVNLRGIDTGKIHVSTLFEREFRLDHEWL